VRFAATKMFETADSFVREVVHARSEADLTALLSDIAREMGFSYFALAHHVDAPRAPPSAIRLHNYPSGWVEYFDGQKLGTCDPVHRASHVTSVGFRWANLGAMIRLTPRDLQVLAEASRHGIGDGFTVPANVPGESNGSCSFATGAGGALREEQLPAAQLVGAFAFEAARRLRRSCAGARSDPPRLTDRQRDCLMWAARGKTAWETSRILGVSQETVVQHLKQARERYGVANGTLLAVCALFDGTISFAEVLKR
jgi:LuxR family quorum-sensing system transcriptional regulator CciR